jgi:hypothetical protein
VKAIERFLDFCSAIWTLSQVSQSAQNRRSVFPERPAVETQVGLLPSTEEDVQPDRRTLTDLRVLNLYHLMRRAPMIRDAGGALSGGIESARQNELAYNKNHQC